MRNWTQRAKMRPCPSKNGVTDRHNIPATPDAQQDSAAQDCYLPDFGTPYAVVALVLISQLVAVVLSLARDPLADDYFLDFARISVLMLWMMLACACTITIARPWLVRYSTARATAFSVGLMLASLAVLSEAIYWLGHYFSETRMLASTGIFPADRWEFLTRNLIVGLLVAVGVLRYFYVTHQWRANVEREAEARISALQARIRPHFLFNSMNTIAALTRSDPREAERAIEDLADLFRASLSNPGDAITLEEELDVTRVYQRMEEQRLGDRLNVDWQLHDVPLDTRVPGLTIQPLLENAIYHGIEPLANGGVVTVVGETCDGMVLISVSNPLAPVAQRRASKGHRLALDNIRQRLELAYGDRARLEVEELADSFRVQVGFPLAA
jgi:two-component system sensor histidine kinase AlgZ